MKKISSVISLVIFFLIANQIWAAEWTFYASYEDGKKYYDKNSIKKVNKNIVSVSTKTIYNESGKSMNFSFLKNIGEAPDNPYILNHQIVLNEIDCINKKINVTSITIYDEAGKVIASSQKFSDEWDDIRPHFHTEILKNIVCSVVKTSKAKKK